MFFASREGHMTETSKYIASTALSHAIGYRYAKLEKPYIMIGSEAENPSYQHLSNLPFIVSDAEPIDVSISENTFRSTTYTAERNITSTDEDVARYMGNTKGVPQRAGKSMSGWHRVREYVGAEPDSTYQFTLFGDVDSLPDKLRFRIGIGRSGEMISEQTEDADKVTLSEFLLKNVYNLDKNDLMEVMQNCDAYEKDTDPRLHRFVNVDTQYVEEEIMDKIEW